MSFKLGIVSSYDTLCGNATYSQALLDGLPAGIEPVKIEVPVKLQKFRNTAIEKRILQQVANCDGVNIQMELGLYGPNPRASIKFLKKIIKAAKRVSLTMHRVEEPPLNYIRSIYNLLKERKFLRSFFSSLALNHVFSQYKTLIKFAANNRATFIVHTYRERERIFYIMPNANIVVHPIIWPSNYCEESNLLDASAYENLFKGNKLPVIGLFGFMSDYKNFLQIVRVALHENKYRVLLVGGTHPESPSYGKRIVPLTKDSRYNMSEVKAISDIAMQIGSDGKQLLISVHSPKDPELVHLIRCVDIVGVPYSEVGQSASGIASLAIQFGKRVFFSDTNMSRELFKFLNREPYTFDTNSDLSLASALKRTSEEEEHSIFFHEHDFNSNIAAYLDSLNVTLEEK